jgi:hypothetical protein
MLINNHRAPLLVASADQPSAMRSTQPNRWARHLRQIAASFPLARPGVTAGDRGHHAGHRTTHFVGRHSGTAATLGTTEWDNR